MDQPSGPNQHYLPRFLQRGFAIRKGGKNPLVWYFKRNGDCSDEKVSDIGADEYFYGHPSVSPVDKSLKEVESDCGEMVAKLRRLTTSNRVNEPLIPHLLAHLSIRTKNLRLTFGSATAELMRRMRRECDSPAGRAYLRRLLDQQMESEMEKLLANEPYRSVLARAHPRMRDQITSQARETLRQLNVSRVFGGLLDHAMPLINFAALTCDAHVKSLAKMQGGVPQRIDALVPLQWHLVIRPKGTFILGDIAVIAQPEPSSPLQSPLKANATPHMILLPISDSHLIVGSALSVPPTIDADAINLASAELSAEFFIASQATERESGYVAHLGDRANFLTDEEFQEVIHTTFERE